LTGIDLGRLGRLPAAWVQWLATLLVTSLVPAGCGQNLQI